MKKSIFENKICGKHGYTLPQTAIDEYTTDSVSESLLRENKLDLPSLDEYSVSLHFRSLLADNDEYNKSECFHGVRYLRSVIDDVSKLDGFTGIHPYQLGDAGQGALELLFTAGHMISDMFGMDMFSLQSATKMQAMFTMLAIAKAHRQENDVKKNVILVSTDACKCALKTAAEFGFEVRVTDMTVDAVKSSLDENVLLLILKNPTRDGKFVTEISEIASLAHDAGVIVCCDASHVSSLIGIARPGDMGFDMMCFDMAEAFAISNSRGESACVAVGVKNEFTDYLPVPVVDIDEEEQYFFNYDRPKSIGKVNAFYGDFTAWIKALAFILTTGFDGFKEIAEVSALNVNYMKLLLSKEKSFVLKRFIFDNTAFEPSFSLDKSDIDEFAANYGKK